jgi:putative ABC transport system substrate-binding protein
MRRRDFLVSSAGAAFAPALLAVAQEPAGVPRIAILMGGTPVVEARRLAVFREALEGLGYVDGRTVHIELNYVEGREDRFEPMAREIVSRQPSVIACVGRQETVALQAATRRIPIVFIQVPDPVAMGLVASLARPGGNTTGFTQMTGELDPKRLELLREIAPSVSRAAFLIQPRLTPGLEKRFADAEAAARALGIELRRIDYTTSAELTKALETIGTSAGEALLVMPDPLIGVEESRIIDFATAHRVPTVFEQKPPVVKGGLLGYGPDLIENARLAAGYVDKLLKGATPADLPVQRPTKFELVINLKTAKALGLTVPQSLLARADEVIE